jgi:16S rRNA (cytosine967-C5)-methyltransferase
MTRTITEASGTEIPGEPARDVDDGVSVDAIPLDAVAPLIAAVASALAGTDRADRIARQALRKLALPSHVARRTFARTIIGTAGLAIRLAHLVGRAHVDVGDARLLAAAWLVDQGGAPVRDVCMRLALDDEQERALAAMQHRAWPSDARTRLVVERAVPPVLLDHLSPLLSLGEIDKLFAALNTPGPMCARTNTRRTTRASLLDALRARGAAVRAGEFAPAAIVFESRYDVDNCSLARDGFYTVQDEGSQLIAHAAAPHAGERVLDMCAGRGGKTLALVERAGDDVQLTVTDVDDDALAAARGRLRRHAASADVVVIDSRAHSEGSRISRVAARGPFDVVLIDAPCTSSGALRRGPDARMRIDTPTIARATATQRALLVEATQLTKRNGRVIYATCSVLPAENDAIVDEALARGDLVPDKLPLDDRLLTHAGSRSHLWPHVHGTDGFFIAGLRRVR